MEPEKTVGFQIRTLNNLMKRDVERSEVFQMLQSTGLHGWAIRFFYKNRDRDVFQRDFETAFSIRRSTASNILKRMENNGLIVRKEVSSDARLKKIVLTEKAIEYEKMIIEDIKKREKRLTQGVSPAELKTFFRVMEQVRYNLEEQND